MTVDVELARRCDAEEVLAALAAQGLEGEVAEDCHVTLRSRTREGTQDAGLIGEWVHANHAFHDVIYAAAAAPFVERLAKSARRTFSGPAVWAPGDHSIDDLYLKNDRQHRAILQALAAGSARGARELAREHVLSS